METELLQRLQAEAARRHQGGLASRVQAEIARRQAPQATPVQGGLTPWADPNTLAYRPTGYPAQEPSIQRPESITPRAYAPPAPVQPGTMGDVARSFGSGLLRGGAGLLELPDMAVRGLAGTAGMAMERAGLAEPGARERFRDAAIAIVGQPGEESAVADSLTGGALTREPQTTAGEYARTVGEFVPGTALMGGGGLGNLIRFAAIPGVASEAAGQATEGSAAEPYARFAAAVLTPTVMTGIGPLARAIVAPGGRPDPHRLAMALVLEDAGVPITAGQRLGSDQLLRREMMTGGGQRLSRMQDEAFTAAALRTIGDTTNRRVSPEVMNANYDRIGSVFRNVTAGVDVSPSVAASQAIDDIVNRYARGATGNTAMAIRDINTKIMDAATGGRAIPANVLTEWRSELSALTRSSDAGTRQAAIDMLGEMDHIIGQRLAQLGRFDDVARLAEARGQYRNFLALERAATTAAGIETAMVTPAALRGAVLAQGRRDMALGRRDIGELARAGQAIMTPPRNSGTPAGLAASGVTSGVLTGAGAVVGSPLGPAGTMVGAIAANALPPTVRAATMSPWAQNALSRWASSPGGVNSGYIGALAGAPQQTRQ